MNQDAHLIRLVAGIEVRPPGPEARFTLERERAARIGAHIGADLADCVEAVTGGHLAIGPALLEPGQVLAPEPRAPWRALARAARLDRPQAPGMTSIGAHHGRLPDPALGPDPAPPTGQFLCLPLLLRVEQDRAALLAALEQRLFDSGGLRPPAMGELASATGLEPVHGQLMTLTDLMALVKMQLAGAGLDPFWPPIEHMLLLPEQPAEIELPAGLQTQWRPEQGLLAISLSVDDAGEVAAEAPRLWWRAFRQQTALLDQHRIEWRVEAGSSGLRIDPAMRWAEADGGASNEPDGLVPEPDPELGLIGFRRVHRGRCYRYYPLRPDGIGALQSMLAASDAGSPA
jgi:hypothetical protein